MAGETTSNALAHRLAIVQGGGGVVTPTVAAVYSSDTHNFVFDGNSLIAGVGASTASGILPAQLASALGDIPVANVGLGGQDIPNMTSRVPSKVTPQFVTGKTNVLLVWEFTNSNCNNPGVDGPTAWTQFQSYISAVKTGHPEWLIVVLTTIPRYGLYGTTSNDAHTGALTAPEANARLSASDAAIKAGYIAAGASAVVDVRADGTFAYVAGSTAPSGAAAALYSDTTHLVDPGYAAIAGYVLAVLKQTAALNAVPKLVTATIPKANASQIVLQFSSALDVSKVPAASAFAISNSAGTDTVTGVSISGSTVTLTKSRASLGTDVVSVTYTPPGANNLTRSGDNYVVAGVTKTVRNRVGLTFNYMRLTSLVNMTETVEASGGYSYKPTVLGYDGYGTPISTGKPATTLPLNADGAIGYLLRAIGPSSPIFGFSSSAGATTFANLFFGIFQDSNQSVATYLPIANGAVQSPDVVILPEPGDYVQVRRTSGNAYLEVSKDGGTTFTLLKAYASVGQSVLYPFFQTGNTALNGLIMQPYATASLV